MKKLVATLLLGLALAWGHTSFLPGERCERVGICTVHIPPIAPGPCPDCPV